VHRAAGRGPVQRSSFTPPITNVTEAPARPSAAGTHFLPLVPAPDTLPLARSAGVSVVQRHSKGAEALPGMGATSGHPATEEPRSSATNPFVPAPGAAHGRATDTALAATAAAEKLDIDDVVEVVIRRLTHSLAVESERHGGRQWP
jgi:hypothetical protein